MCITLFLVTLTSWTSRTCPCYLSCSERTSSRSCHFGMIWRLTSQTSTLYESVADMAELLRPLIVMGSHAPDAFDFLDLEVDPSRDFRSLRPDFFFFFFALFLSS